MHERPLDATSPFVFLVGGKGTRRMEPLGYDAVVRLFARRLDKLGLRTPETTPQALRHTHATAMWEGGMRELSLQKRLGHASSEWDEGLHPRLRRGCAGRLHPRVENSR